ncbi:M48 family metallopeptidase [Gleimia sp. 6138-11-ORH1]|uniref:M48 metallopeptidase family protein n=1 Tax=Gleimia sp. 6138-11-ORH1 TaxID=2973937 RepID=UPI0021697895|nr:M48 family metallopeptidase [Gleimia sp. 6138-11-ORH1]MCS4484462.1 M48 family metallopeptidase [Gleimia sp. 6138-11-ORH1]
MSGAQVYLVKQVELEKRTHWWIAGKQVDLASLSQLPKTAEIIFRGRGFKLTETHLYVKDLSTLDVAMVKRLLSQLMRWRIESLLNQYQQVFGVEVARVTIRPMRSRWGSCRPNRRFLTFNLHLVHLADELLEYVVIHEFVHFFARGHGRDFYALLQQYCPDWKTRRQMLNASIGG